MAGDPTGRTLAFYDANAAAYAAAMLPDTDTLAQFRAFVRLLPPGGHVLDLGCGAGHYAKLLRDAGFRLTLVDGSPGLAAEAQVRTGLPVRVQLFQDFRDPPVYDGIWACASLLHVPEQDLPDVFARVAASLKPGGIFYCSFKETGGIVDRHGRHYGAMNPARLTELLAHNGLEALQEFSVDSAGYDKVTSRFIAAIAVRRGGSEA